MGIVLGINGEAGSGKDTTADYLIREHGWDAKLSFAFNLKEMCKAIFSLKDYDVETQDGKSSSFSKSRVFTEDNLGSILVWMANTHPSAKITGDSYRKVASLVGKTLNNPRDVLQIVGTDVCRELVPSYHVDILKKKIENNRDGRFVITDVRFPNEGDFILDVLGGIVVRIDRPKAVVKNINKQHPSETAMLEWGKFTDVIDNSLEGLDCLYRELNSFLERNGLCQSTITL